MAAKPRPIRNAFATFIPDREPGRELDGARVLPLDRLDPNPQQARQTFDPAKLDELTASVRQHGVLEPILVRPQGERYEIVAGERRFRAAQRAGLAEIPAIIQELDDAQAAYITAVENLQREDLDLEDEARQFATLVTQTGLSHRKLAEQLGINHDYITRRLALLPHPRLLAAIRTGECSQESALRLLARPALLTDVDSGAISAAEAVVQLRNGPEPAETVERADLTHGASPDRDERLRPEFRHFRWRWADTVGRELRRISTATLDDEELAALDPYLEEWQATLEAIRARRLAQAATGERSPRRK
jgi:ParB/RepB/Spo0J family partition protein